MKEETPAPTAAECRKRVAELNVRYNKDVAPRAINEETGRPYRRDRISKALNEKSNSAPIRRAVWRALDQIETERKSTA